MIDLTKSGDCNNTPSLPPITGIQSGHLRFATMAVALFAVTGCSSLYYPGTFEQDSYEIEDDYTDPSEQFSKRVYGSIGMGASRLEPDTSANSVFDVNDRVVPGGQVTLGADLSKTFSVEIHSADLGSAGLSPQGRINYHINGGSALMYAGSDRKNRSGLSGYGRLGLGAMDNSAVGNVTFQRANDTQILIGAGAEYGWRNGIGVRGEVIVFDKDAQFAQLGLIYRLGGRNGGSMLAEIPMDSPTTVSQAPIEMPEPAAAVPDVLASYTADEDQDGIFDTLDDCPASAPGIAVDNAGCAVFNGVIDGVNFEPGSAQLTQQARSTLDNVVETLSEHPDVLVSIGAHTDSEGNDRTNMSLSRHRAVTVARYLINRGVPKNLMSARAFGELAPIADNTTDLGRAQNRRVELVVSKGIEQ